jgi:heat-inducible transcriptional repressor
MDERQKNILKEIVESYIKNVKPVGSKSLCNKFRCSSATIRNEMAHLEDFGYIEKNHISSGRIPSEKGYKYYVEHLMKPDNLTGKELLKLQTIFTNNEIELSDAISKCMEIISDLTNYASVVLGKSSNDNLLQKVEIISLDESHIVALVCTDKGLVENKRFTLPENTDLKEVIKTCELVNKMLIGTPINEVSERLEFEVKPIIIKQLNQYETVYNIFYDAFNDFINNNSSVHISGRDKIFEQPEYDDAEDIRALATKLDDMSLLTKIYNDDDNENNIEIKIGKESKFDPNVTVIKKKFKAGGEEGTIAVIGPKRMDYGKIVSMLEFVQKEIDERKED